MRKYWVLIVAVMIAAGVHADEPAPSMNRADWAADLDTLYTAMKTIHPNLHHKTDAATMDGAVAALHKQIATDSWPQYVTGLYRLLALVGDGHTTFYPVPAAGPGFDTRLPILTDVFADGVHVTAADAPYRDAVGGKVVAIDGRPMVEVAQTLMPYWAHENERWVVRWMPLIFSRPGYLHGTGIADGAISDPVVFRIEKDGRTRDFAVTPLPASVDSQRRKSSWVHARDEAGIAHPTPLHGKDVPFDFTYLADKRAVYAVYRECADSDKETVAAFADRLFKFVDSNPVDKLIIDVRDNGGGDNYLNQPIILGMIRSKVDRPGHLFVLTGRRTFSAAQNFVADAERLTEAIFVGEPTGSSPNLYGDAKQMELPHTHLHPMVATIYWELSDPRDKRGWIFPDVPVPETFADYLAGRDAALEAALAYVADPAAKTAPPNTRWGRRSQESNWPQQW